MHVLKETPKDRKKVVGKKKKKKLRQLHLPGTDKAVTDIENAATTYREKRDERMELTKVEKTAHDKLLDVMHKHKRKTYVGKTFTVEIEESEEKVKVRARKQEDNGELD